jgi:hypothetical protein
VRFSIRDLLWATALVAMGLGWWVSYRALDAKCLKAVGQAHRLRASLYATTRTFGRTNDSLTWPVDWSVLDEPLVE